MRHKHIEDLSNDMRPKKSISSDMRALLDAEKINARKRIIERGIVHFRADQEFMEALFDAAGKLKTAPGTLCRQIVWEYLKTPQSDKASTLTNKGTKNINKALVAKLELLERTIREMHSYLIGKGLYRKSK
jgi:hypothetical protein